MTEADWTPVATALLGSWPSLVASWGKEAIAAYLGELRARGVSPGAAVVAIRCCPAEQRFPPSAPALAALARRDPHQPTFAEALLLIFDRPGGVLAARTHVDKARWELGERQQLDDEAAWERAAEMHPLIALFVQRQGLRRLRALDLEVPEYGAARRKMLADEWEEFVDVADQRDAASLVAGRRGELARFDPLTALTGPRLLDERAS